MVLWFFYRRRKATHGGGWPRFRDGSGPILSCGLPRGGLGHESELRGADLGCWTQRRGQNCMVRGESGPLGSLGVATGVMPKRARPEGLRGRGLRLGAGRRARARRWLSLGCVQPRCAGKVWVARGSCGVTAAAAAWRGGRLVTRHGEGDGGTRKRVGGCDGGGRI